jgi:hypothetical protein
MPRAYTRTRLAGCWVDTVARLLLARRQRDVLAWLRFPATDAVRRIVRKVDRDALSVRRLVGLRERIGDDDCQRLARAALTTYFSSATSSTFFPVLASKVGRITAGSCCRSTPRLRSCRTRSP